MAARRVLSLLASKSSSNPLSRDISWIGTSARYSSHIHEQLTKRLQSSAGSTTALAHGQPDTESCSSASKTGISASTPGTTDTTLTPQVNSKLKISERHDFIMVFTCKVCDTRSIKTACRKSYDKGVVIARCDGCNNLHLIADRLGWFGDPGSVEDFLASRGETVKKGSSDSLSITLEDLAGKV